jgi:hypothetical protein
MRDQIQARLGELKQEYEKGQIDLYKLEQQQAHVHETMLRISGAIQVLEELLTRSPPVGQDGVQSGEIRALNVRSEG